MTRYWRLHIPAAVCALCTLPLVFAQNVQVETGQNGTRVQTNTNQNQNLRGNATTQQGVAAQANRGTALRVSELMGLQVRNHQDEDLGNIEDVVIDSKTGQVRYVAVSMGGFLGIGDSLFAVPYKAIQIRSEADDPDDLVVLLNVNKEIMEDAEGFNQDNWPNMADTQWQQKNDARYRVQHDNDRNTRVNPNTDSRTPSRSGLNPVQQNTQRQPADR